MVFSNGGGGTLTLPSPTHVHHADMSAAVRSLRRSMSRSPSKLNLAAAASAQTAPATPTLPPTPSAEQNNAANVGGPGASFGGPSGLDGYFALPANSGRINVQHGQQTPGLEQPISFLSENHSDSRPMGTPSKSNFKLSVRSSKPRPTITRPIPRSRTSPKSPLRRVFGGVSESPNVIHFSMSGAESTVGKENNNFSEFALGFSPAARKLNEQPSRHSMHLDISGSSKHNLSISMDTNTSISPMKRGEASPDSTSLGSPVAKRRSLHSISVTRPDLDFPDVERPTIPHQNSFDIHDDTTNEYLMSSAAAAILSSLPKRNSLRKTTLKKRNSTSWGRRAGEKQLAQLEVDLGTPLAKGRPRMSVDNWIPPDERGGPFPTVAPLPNPSAHPIPRPHPLSRALTQSSSNSSMGEDSPTHFPVHHEKSRVPPFFSKSLNAPQPTTNQIDPMATPDFKHAKPIQQAFMSTGLVSKMNRHPERAPAQSDARAMPDTPCKRQSYPLNTFPPSSGKGRKRGSFKEFDFSFTPIKTGLPFSRSERNEKVHQSGGLFKSLTSHAPKTSWMNLDGDESGDLTDESPPTPTKIQSRSQTMILLDSSPSASRFIRPQEQHSFGPNSESTPLQDNMIKDEAERDGRLTHDVQIPSVSKDRAVPKSVSAFHRSHVCGGRSHLPSPLKIAATRSSLASMSRQDTKMTSLSPASIISSADSQEKQTPQTPGENSMLPPHNSLSFAGLNQDNNTSPLSNKGKFVIPTTPSTHRESFSVLAARRNSSTPQNTSLPIDVDESLHARFNRTEVIGRGVSSQVYRVVKSSVSATLTTLSATPDKRASGLEQVFAVKRIVPKTYSIVERQARLREVSILQALSHSDKVIRFIDSWEDGHNLYIQTEYCEEGSLDSFLGTAGDAGRLDDFRIWKILIEIAQGLAAVHDSGFVHLDLKPANVFITFEGSLKLGDFGLAAHLPVDDHDEGDRQYMAPEIMTSHKSNKFDKPCDIFSLGLILFEMASNSFMPDNGPMWHLLRNGDLSAYPITISEDSALERDANGLPISHDMALPTSPDDYSFHYDMVGKSPTHDPRDLFGSPKRNNHLQHPPSFMVDRTDENSLDSIMKLMLHPTPDERATVHQILRLPPLDWVSSRRQAGATVFEGNWGPQHDIVDTEMTDA